MHKSKTHSGAKKRFKLTSSGKIKRFHAYRSHILTKMTRKRKRHLRRPSLIHPSDMSRVKHMLVI